MASSTAEVVDFMRDLAAKTRPAAERELADVREFASIAIPAKSCDCHVHVFGPASRYPYQANRGYTPPDAPFEALSAMHHLFGVERAVIVQASAHGTDNRAVVESQRCDRSAGWEEAGMHRVVVGQLGENHRTEHAGAGEHGDTDDAGAESMRGSHGSSRARGSTTA